MLNQMVADEQPEYFSSFFTTHAILPHIGKLELVKEYVMKIVVVVYLPQSLFYAFVSVP